MKDDLALRISGDLAERLRVEADATDEPPGPLAASLIDEGLKSRRFPGIVYMDGTAGRRACVSGGPDVWQIIRVLREVPAEVGDPVETICIESNLHPRQVELAVRFHETYPEEIEMMIDLDERAVQLIDEMISKRDRSVSHLPRDDRQSRNSLDRDSGLSI